MDVQTPRDASLRNIIDKLAEFVARNGPEFELITKQKQQGNPKFDFLYGGEYASYYQYRVATEQAFLKQNDHQQPPPTPGAMQHMQQLHQQQQQQQTHFNQVQTAAMLQQQQQQQLPTQPQQQIGSHMHDMSSYGSPMQHNQQHGMWPTTPNITPNIQANTQPQQQQQQNGNSSALAMNLTSQIEVINGQQNTLREQIHQSEANLSAQHTAMMTQQTKQIEDAITAAQNTKLEKLAEEQSIVLKDFDAVLQPIIESCTKDSISAGKNWILQHSTDSAKNNVVLQYLLKKALVNGSTFQQKLHLIYLVNDILHHCMRKNVNDLKNSLENVVIPMFCSADLIATNEQRAKLTKLLSLWESKAKFFDACVISKLQSPDSSMQEYKTNLQNTHNEIVSKFAQNTKATLDNYQKQHQVFVQHATQQIAQFEQQKQQLEQQMLSASAVQQQQQQQPPPSLHQQQSIKQIPSLMSQKISMPGTEPNDHLKPPGVDENSQGANVMYHQQAQQQGVNNMYPYAQQQQPHPTSSNPFAANTDARNQQNFFIPDLSKPPPGFGALNASQIPQLLQQQYTQMNNNIPSMAGNNNNNIPSMAGNSNNNNSNENTGNANPQIDMVALNAAIEIVQLMQHQQQPPQSLQHQQQQQLEPPELTSLNEQGLGEDNLLAQMPEMPMEEQIPTGAYYDLPAGLMVPLIRLEDYNYRALDPADIRIPVPTPQNERLTNALKAFYAPPSHDRPRDNEGWEKLGLYEYYKVKNAAKKQKEEEIKNGTREKSRSPSPIILEKPKPPNKRCYRSKSRSRSRSRSRTPIRSRSRSRSRSRGLSETSNSNNNNNNRNNNSNNRNKQRNQRHDRDSSSSRENRAERNSNNSRRVERERSPTPPSFFGNSFAKTNEFIEESNKGHQMLMKMGWSGTGTGLGSKNQGINTPISAGEVRDRQDLYKGVGINLNDPFESFRKNKGAAFVHRMRTRDDKS